MSKHTISPLILVFSILLSAVCFFFLGVTFPTLSIIERLLMALIGEVLFIREGRKGWQAFYLAALTLVSVFVSLTTAFGGTEGDGPLSFPLMFHPWYIFLAALAVAFAATTVYEKQPSPNRFPAILFWVFALNWCLLAVNVKFFEDWKMENYLTIPFALLIYITHRWFRLSNVSYGLIFAYLMLHIVGSHYTYSEVPLGFWLRDAFDIARNHYDRIVHFGFGFLLAYPLREMAVRITSAKGIWALYIPVEFVLAFSAIYEIIEWIIAVIYGGDLGIAYLGTQGDVWDAIKDMALAGGGALIAMAVVLFIHLAYDRRAFWKELRESLHIKDKNIMGEEALERLRQR